MMAFVDCLFFNFTQIDIVMRPEAEWVQEFHGFLGILNILGQEHLMLLTGMDEVCSLPHKLAPFDQPSAIYELQQIELVPFDNSADV